MCAKICIEIVNSVHFYIKCTPVTMRSECTKLITVDITGPSPACFGTSVPFSGEQKANFKNYFVPES